LLRYLSAHCAIRALVRGCAAAARPRKRRLARHIHHHRNGNLAAERQAVAISGENKAAACGQRQSASGEMARRRAAGIENQPSAAAIR